MFHFKNAAMLPKVELKTDLDTKHAFGLNWSPPSSSLAGSDLFWPPG
jgi:hypothetical protein